MREERCGDTSECGQQKATAGTLQKSIFNNIVVEGISAFLVTKCSSLPVCSNGDGEEARGTLLKKQLRKENPRYVLGPFTPAK